MLNLKWSCPFRLQENLCPKKRALYHGGWSVHFQKRCLKSRFWQKCTCAEQVLQCKVTFLFLWPYWGDQVAQQTAWWCWKRVSESLLFTFSKNKHPDMEMPLHCWLGITRILFFLFCLLYFLRSLRLTNHTITNCEVHSLTITTCPSFDHLTLDKESSTKRTLKFWLPIFCDHPPSSSSFYSIWQREHFQSYHHHAQQLLLHWLCILSATVYGKSRFCTEW
jgi:hypothetical protein